ncbi:MAG: orotidine-5'-phosphate decarboxylase [Parcubacteria group bacterium]|nr:orotidine-5'-phosphate decarboxylase [Parcubacteria group bacterium]
MPTFMEMLRERERQGFSICVGLDSDVQKIPLTFRRERLSGTQQIAFNLALIEYLINQVGAFKLNGAFYAHSEDGDHALCRTIEIIHDLNAKIPVILDVKRADIGNTNNGYVVEAFERYRADAVTVNPYFGGESLDPFLVHKDKGIIILCRTSNPGAAEMQDRPTLITLSELNEFFPGGYPANYQEELGWQVVDMDHILIPYYQIVALLVSRRWNKNKNCALVVGGTAKEALRRVRILVGDEIPLLVPGVGKQGGTVEDVMKNGLDSKGGGVIINSSRDIIFASEGEDNVGPTALVKLTELNDKVGRYRPVFPI